MSVIDLIRKNLPTILSLGAGIGSAVTPILSANAALRASEKIAEIEKDGHEMTKSEFIREIVPIYIPSGVSLLLTEGCIAGGWKVNKDIQAGLLVANAGLAEFIRRYREKVPQEIDEAIIEEIRAEVREELKNEMLEELDNGERLWIFDFIDEPVKTTKAEVFNCFLYANEQINKNRYVLVDDICDYLGVKRNKWNDYRMNDCDVPGPGAISGWSDEELIHLNGHEYLEFWIEENAIEDDSGLLINLVHVAIQPSFDYDMPIGDVPAPKIQAL